MNDTTKDQSSIQQYMSSVRTTEKQTNVKLNRVEMRQNRDLSEDAEYRSNSESNSIFTQNLVFQSKTPTKLRFGGNQAYVSESEYRRSDNVNRKNDKDSIAMRIRGKSNNVEMRAGSLRQTIYEQNNHISLKSKRKANRDKLRKLERIERYREERLLKELRLLEEEKKILQQQQRQEMIKEK